MASSDDVELTMPVWVLRHIIGRGAAAVRTARANVDTTHPDARSGALDAWMQWGDTYCRAPDDATATVTVPAHADAAARRWLGR